MSIIVITLFIAAGTNIGLALSLMCRQYTKSIYWFIVTLILSFIWCTLIGIFYLIPIQILSLEISRLFYVIASMIALSFYFFSRNFPTTSKIIKANEYIFHAVIFLILIIDIYYVRTVTEVSIIDGISSANINIIGYIIFFIIFVGYVSVGYFNMIKQYYKSSSLMKTNLGIIMISVLISFVMGIWFDLLLPIITYQYIWIGPLFTLLTIFLITKFVISKNY